MLYVGAVKSRAGEASSWAGRRTMERGGELTDREGKVTARDGYFMTSGCEYYSALCPLVQKELVYCQLPTKSSDWRVQGTCTA
eukprot:7810736-Pyramimonas_sp.AAC.1